MRIFRALTLFLVCRGTLFLASDVSNICLCICTRALSLTQCTLLHPWPRRNADEIRSYPVTVRIDGKCTLKGSTFPSLEAAVDFFSENMLDGVHLVTVSGCAIDRAV